TSLILADARLHGARAEVAVGIGATNATVGDHLRVSVPPGSAFAAGEPVTLTFRTSFLRLILAHGAVRS
ncbi:MAG: hypothetical protein JWM53_337, partial [bacterium]|nr:hypothetical protein [bacterium]